LEIILYSFLICLLAFTLTSKLSKEQFKLRSNDDWLLDLTSLAMHSIILPFLNIILLYALLDTLIPSLKATVDFGWPGAILFHVLLDYAWYWNHRIFHGKTWLWNFHKVHHAPKSLDILKTPRNSVLSHFMMVYWWFIGLATYVALDPECVIIIGSFSVMINFWGHSPFDFHKDNKFGKIFSMIFITPKDHHWHHSTENPRCNFATVYTFWDRLHGTLQRDGEFPKSYGFATKDNALKQLFYPGPH